MVSTMGTVIVISSMHARNDESDYSFSSVRNTYIDAIVSTGAAPLLAPVTEDEAVWRQIFDLADGIILSGGKDIHPARYNEKVRCLHRCESDARDSMEWAFARWARREKKPLLGVCRGMQVMNVVNGGCLHLDLPESYGVHDYRDSLGEQAWNSLVDEVIMVQGSKLRNLLGAESLPINSLHRQGVRTLGEGLNAVGWSKSGLIEVIELGEEHPFYVGVQFHPEAITGVVPEWQILFEHFVGIARKQGYCNVNHG